MDWFLAERGHDRLVLDGGGPRALGRLLLFVELAVLHVEDGAHVLLQVVVVPVSLLAERTLHRIVPAHKKKTE